MYTIYADYDDIIYAPGALSSLGYSVSEAKLTMEMNKAGSLEFTIPPTNPSYSKLSKLKTIFRVEQDGVEIWRGRLLHDEKDFYNSKYNFCEGELAFLNDSVVPPYEYVDIFLDNLLQILLKYYTDTCSDYRKIVLGKVPPAHSSFRMAVKSTEYSNVLTEIIDKTVNEFNVHLKLRRQDGISYLDYVSNVGNWLDQDIVFGKNLLDLTEYVDASDIYTRVIPLGAKKNDYGTRIDISSVNDGKNYISSETGEKLFGKITRAVVFDDISDPATLKAQGESLLSSSIEMATTIQISAIDLKLLGVDVERLEVGRSVHVISPPHGIDSIFICTKIVLDLLEPDRSEYIFGLNFSSLTGKQVEANKESNAMLQSLNELTDRVTILEKSVNKEV